MHDGMKLLGVIGDAQPLDYGGCFVYQEEEGRVSAELVEVDETSTGKLRWTIYRFDADKCTYVNGVLSDNPSVPDSPAWFADGLGGVASSMGLSEETLIEAFCSDEPMARAQAWLDVGEYFGLRNLDDYPLHVKRRREMEERYPGV